MIHTVKGFSSQWNRGRCFSGVSLFFLWFRECWQCSSAFCKPSLNIWKVSVHIILKPSLEDSEHNLTSMKDECNCPVVWVFFTTVLLGNWDQDWPFSVLLPLPSFPNLLTYWVQHFNSIIFKDFKEFSWNSISYISFTGSSTSWGPLDFTLQNVWLWVRGYTIMASHIIKIFLVQFFCVFFPSRRSIKIVEVMEFQQSYLKSKDDAILICDTLNMSANLENSAVARRLESQSSFQFQEVQY